MRFWHLPHIHKNLLKTPMQMYPAELEVLLHNAEITKPFTDISKSCPSREFLASQICLLTLFAKIKFSEKFPVLQCMQAVKALMRLLD